jgi:hypothetical protein
VLVRVLALSSNRLSGSIPGGFGKYSTFRVLNAADNLLTGDLPPFMGSSANFL